MAALSCVKSGYDVNFSRKTIVFVEISVNWR